MTTPDEIPGFLRFLYGNRTGYVYAPTKTATDFSQYFFAYPSEINELTRFIRDKSSTAEVYIAPALFNERSSLKQHFASTEVVWVEFDGKVPNELPKGIPEPTLKLQSSLPGHEHWYWKLSEPLTDAARVESITRALTYE